MNNYLFVLGRETELCFAELETVMSVQDSAASIQKLSTGLALVQLAPSVVHQDEAGPSQTDPTWWVKRLGGTRLIARQLGMVSSLTAEHLDEFLPVAVREVALSSPTVSAGDRTKLLRGLKQLRPGLRYRPNTDAYLASGLSDRLLRREDGVELLLVTGGEGVLIAEVVAVQDTRAWTERDRGLPAPDAVAGMVPPKLARIMVNLAEPARPLDRTGQLLDPFCGSGQIPIEALRVGWDSTASDLDPRAIERTQTNLTWAQQRSADAARQEWAVFQAGIETLGARFEASSFDAIVTEPDLGPPLKASAAAPSNQVLDRVAHTISLAVEAGRSLLRPGGRIVIVIPIIAGHRIVDRLIDPERSRRVDDPVFSGYLLRETLHYARPDSRVEREIVVLDRT